LFRPAGHSRFGIKKRGDTSAWTDTPEQAALRAAGLLPASANAPLAIAAAGPAGRLTGGEAAPAPGVAEAVREYNERNRPKSLLEQHKERQAAAAAAQKGGKAKKKEKSGEKGDKGKKEKEKGQKRPAAGEWQAEGRARRRDPGSARLSGSRDCGSLKLGSAAFWFPPGRNALGRPTGGHAGAHRPLLRLRRRGVPFPARRACRGGLGWQAPLETGGC
jgi:hypothetical protein